MIGEQSAPPDFLARMSGAMLAASNVEELTRPLLELLELVTGLESTYLTRVDGDAGVQTILYSRNSRTMQIPEGLSVPWDDTLCKRALDEGRNFTDDVASCWGDCNAAQALGIRTYASVPVYVDDNALYGTLCAASSDSRPMTPQGRQVLSLFSTLISKQLQREQLLDRLRQSNAALEAESTTDALTGLPNRRFAMAELRRLFALARRTRQQVLLAFIDLDGFKAINDTHGHEAGDRFLIAVGQRLTAGLRKGDVLGRLGGDEFIIIGLSAPGEAAEDAAYRRLAPLLRGRYDLESCSLDYPGASFGVIQVDPDSTTPEDALREADARMYADKKARRAG